MSIHTNFAAMTPILPENSPFTQDQRAWLSGFFAGMFSLDDLPIAANTEMMPILASEAAPAASEEEDTPWHDPSLTLQERMEMATGRALPLRMMAAMAQQDCGQCGSSCAEYSRQIFDGGEAKLNLCAPGGKETARMLKQLALEIGDAPCFEAALVPTSSSGAAQAKKQQGYSRDLPVIGHFKSRRRLNGAGSAKETYHVEIDLKGAGIAYEVGDSLGVFPTNAPQLVEEIAAALQLSTSEPVAVRGEIKPFLQWLKFEKDLGTVPDALYAALADKAAGDEKARLLAMAAGEGAEGAVPDVLALLQQYEHLSLTAAACLEALEDLQPRLYSISSSPRAKQDMVTLTVDCVKYNHEKRQLLGVASTWLGERLRGGTPLKIYVQKAHGFALPQTPETPIIMVGPGTGIAPFRAFLQERLATKAMGKAIGAAWLFFGHQHEASDFFYREELEGLQAEGTLTRLSTAWSRDGGTKTYVQDKMRQEASELWKWLEKGAHFYICGDAKRMAKDVENALLFIAESAGGKSADEAKVWLHDLKKIARFQADVY